MLEAPTEGADMEEIAPVWYIHTGDRIRLNIKKAGSAERTWQFFRWNDEVSRIYL